MTARAGANRPAAVNRFAATLSRLSPTRRGALIYVAASLVFITTDSLTKVLVSDVPVVDVVFGRNLAYLSVVVLVAGGRSPRRLLATAHPWAQLARGLAMFGTTATYFTALSLLPIAEVSTLSSTTPLIVVALAGPLLGERVTRAAILGAVVGFAGVLVMVGLDPAHLDLAVLVPLANAVIFALFTLLTRALRGDPPGVTMFWSGLVPMVAGTVLFAAVPTASVPSPGQWAAIGLVGVMALSGHRLLVAAYRWGRASDLAPLGYLSVLWAFLVGAIVFLEPVELRAVAGALAIAAGGIVVLRSSDEEPIAPASGEYAGPLEDGGAAARPGPASGGDASR